METVITALVCAASVTLFTASSAQAQDASEMAKKLANPIASLINVPIQTNYDEGFGDDDDGDACRQAEPDLLPVAVVELHSPLDELLEPVFLQVPLADVVFAFEAHGILFILPLRRFERLTYGLGNRRSIHLSYRGAIGDYRRSWTQVKEAALP